MDSECSRLVRLDAKGRFVVPVDLRALLLPHGAPRELTVTRHFREDCLCLFRRGDWQLRRADFLRRATPKRDDQLMVRRFIVQAVSANPDANWRVSVPPQLRRQAKLVLREDCLLMFMGGHWELWHPEFLEETLGAVPPDVSDALSQTLSYRADDSGRAV